MSNPDTLFFTCANKAYEDFALLYAGSVLHHVRRALVEIGLEDAPSFEAENAEAITLLRDAFGPEGIVFRSVSWSPNGNRIIPGTIRFISQPLTKAEYVYIGDIDIILLDPKLVDTHLAFMAETGLPYSNSVRAGTRRLSGLHFSRYDAYYPVPDVEDFLPAEGEEHVLYELCRRRGHPLQDQKWFRPVHGIHASPRRPNPLGSAHLPGWDINKAKLAAYRTFAASPVLSQLRPLLSSRIRSILSVLDQMTLD